MLLHSSRHRFQVQALRKIGRPFSKPLATEGIGDIETIPAKTTPRLMHRLGHSSPRIVFFMLYQEHRTSLLSPARDHHYLATHERHHTFVPLSFALLDGHAVVVSSATSPHLHTERLLLHSPGIFYLGI